ncbi:MAG: NTP transferase domain-containing protein [Candidatus Zipacnadales bacterium]
MKATVLAAGAGGELAASAGVPAKALVPVGGQALVTYVVAALQGAQTIDETIVICGPERYLPEETVLGVQQVQAPSKRFADTIRTAATVGGEGLLCLVTADLPALTPAAVDATVKFALDSQADLTYTMVDIDTVLQAFPGTVRTVVRLREGRMTGGNIVIARSSALLHSLERIDVAFGRRKSIVGLTLLFGPLFLLRLGLGRLSVRHIVARGEAILGCRIAVHKSSYPEIAFDVDRPSDLEFAEGLLGAQQERRKV